MRLQGIQLQGLREPAGARRLALDSGYNVLALDRAERANAIVRALDLLLYAPERVTELHDAVDPEAGVPPLVGVSFLLGATSYRLLADLARGRVALARYEPATREYARVTTHAEQISERLRAEGLPPRDAFQLLHRAGMAPLPATSVAAPPSASDAAKDRAHLVARVAALRKARRLWLALEEQQKNVEEQLARRAALGEGIDDLDARVAAFREVLARRDDERFGIERARQELLEQRQRLRAAPASHASWIALGLVLAFASALAGRLFTPWLYGLSLLGAGVAGVAAVLARLARQSMGSLEARLAALRVRERAVERQFEAEGAGVRNLLLALGLGSADELEREANRFRDLQGQADSLREDLERQRSAFPEEAERELVGLEQRLTELGLDDEAAEGEDAAAESPPAEPPAPAPVEDPRIEAALEGLIRAGAEWSALPADDVRAAGTARAGVYLRSLSGGSVADLGFDPDRGWWARTASDAEPRAVSTLGADASSMVETALRFGLIEALAPERPVPLVVGPWLPTDGDEQRGAFARALRRIGTVTQVLQLTTDEAPWSDRAARVADWRE